MNLLEILDGYTNDKPVYSLDERIGLLVFHIKLGCTIEIEEIDVTDYWYNFKIILNDVNIINQAFKTYELNYLFYTTPMGMVPTIFLKYIHENINELSEKCPMNLKISTQELIDEHAMNKVLNNGI